MYLNIFQVYAWVFTFVPPTTAHTVREGYVDEDRLHRLSCCWSVGRLPRHSHLNVIIRHSLASANIPSVFDGTGTVPFGW